MALNLKSVSGTRALMAAVLLLLPLIYFSTAIFGPVSLMPGDGWSQIMGIRILIGRMIAQGMLPLWNPYIFGGMPLLASIQPGALYPPSWLFAILTPRAAMNAMVITTYHLALIGAYLFARRIELDRASALVTGLIFTFGGYLLAHLGHTNRIAAAAWLPWILLAIEHLYRRAAWRWVTFGALFIMLQNLAGEFQMTFYSLLVCGPYALFSLALRPERERRWRVFVYLAAMALSGALLSAIQVIPARELLQLGERAGINYDYFSLYSFPPYHLFALIFPYFFGGAGTTPYYVTFWGNWNPPETTCYVGLAGLLLAFVAISGKWEKQERRMVWFWTVVTLAAMTLAFGSYLPFGLNRLLHRVPVFNLFRAAGRHYFEFSLAIAVLAGMGLNHLTHATEAAQRKRFKWAVAALTILVAATAVAYRFFLDRFPVFHPRYTTAHLLTNPEALIPLLIFALCVAAFLVHIRWRTRATSALMAAVVLIDLASWGWFFEWQVYRFDVAAALSDPPAVTFIKSREADLNSFRIVSQAADPYDKHYRELDYPNVSIARGLQSVNGYDPVRLGRFAAIAGEMSLAGTIPDPGAFGPSAQGFNLLNVRYLLRERSAPAATWSTAVAPELRFSENSISPQLEPGSHVELQADGTVATELALVSAMGNSTDIPDNAPVVRIRLHTRGGRVIEREMQAGRDTSEWAHDRRDVRALLKHRRALIAESFPAADFEGHRYLARFTFDRAEIDYLELDYVAAKGSVQITRASLYDAETRASAPISSLRLAPERWRRVETFGPVDLYENLKALPRAWFVRRVEALPSAEVLTAIKEGKFRDGRPFDPAQTALLETEDFGGKPVRLPETGDPTGAEVRVTGYNPQRLTLRTRHAQPGFLVLSEIWYRGWEAWIDGQRAPVERVNYTLRGLAVPPGEHQVEFVFRAHSFRNGAAWSAAGALLLLLGAVLSFPGVSQSLTTGWPRFVSRLTKLNRFRAIFAVALLLYGAFLFRHAAYAFGGSDATGYANIARAILAGRLVEPLELMNRLNLPDSFVYSLIPLGYVRGPQPGTIAPFYPPGLSLQMVVAAVLLGWKNGPFLISPLSALLSLVLIYLVGREYGLSQLWSAAGAVMLAVCPFFIFFALQPLSDVPALCWSLLVILAALRSQKNERWSLLAGAAFGMAFLVRPTSLLLLLPLCFCLRLSFRSLRLFLLGGAPLAVFFLAFNYLSYANPLQTGYGTLDSSEMVRLSYFAPRFRHYVYWLALTMSPLPLIGWTLTTINRALRWRDRALLITWFGIFLIFYCCYKVYDEWWYTRFLLPGVPALILGTLLSVRHLTEMIPAGRTGQMLLRGVAPMILLAAALGFGLPFNRKQAVTEIGAGEYVHSRSCRWAERLLPDDAVLVAMQMSGALRFYNNRPCVRWDLIEPAQWETLKSRAAEKGLRWYALLMSHEVEDAQKRLPGRWRKIGDYRQVSLWRLDSDS